MAKSLRTSKFTGNTQLEDFQKLLSFFKNKFSKKKKNFRQKIYTKQNAKKKTGVSKDVHYPPNTLSTKIVRYVGWVLGQGKPSKSQWVRGTDAPGERERPALSGTNEPDSLAKMQERRELSY